MNKYLEYLLNPSDAIMALSAHGLLPFLSDEQYIKMKFKQRMGYPLDLQNPVTFNEKLQWLKLHDRKHIYTTMVDKYEAKKYVAGIIGEEYIIPTLGVWDHFDDIDFDKLPEQFVLKCTHDSGGLVICKDKKQFCIEEARKKINHCLKMNFYLISREWPYKQVKPRIVAEKYMGENLQDYKFFCFKGKPMMTLVCTDRFSEKGLCEDFFDNDWNHLDIKRPRHGNYGGAIQKPEHFDLMLELAGKLAGDIPFVRIDEYEIDNKIYFGEITFFPASGFEGFVPADWDMKLGSWIELPIN